MPTNNPTVDELVDEGIAREVAVLIRPFLNRWASRHRLTYRAFQLWSAQNEVTPSAWPSR